MYNDIKCLLIILSQLLKFIFRKNKNKGNKTL